MTSLIASLAIIVAAIPGSFTEDIPAKTTISYTTEVVSGDNSRQEPDYGSYITTTEGGAVWTTMENRNLALGDSWTMPTRHVPATERWTITNTVRVTRFDTVWRGRKLNYEHKEIVHAVTNKEVFFTEWRKAE